MTNTIDEDLSIPLAEKIRQYLNDNQLSANLPDISYEILAMQLIDSLAQTEELETLASQLSNPKNNTNITDYSDPQSADFDPIKAILSLKNSCKDADYNEACWLSFLLVYTDDNAQTDWTFMRLLYSAIGLGESIPKLTWQMLNDAPNVLNERLDNLAIALAQHHPKPKFGHHRAYESLSHLPAVFSSYIHFIRSQSAGDANDANADNDEQGGHQALFQPVDNKIKGRSDVERQLAFNDLYTLIRANVYRFGRLSTFELLCLLGKTGLADIAPDSCYIADASGPKRGAKLLFGMLGNGQLDSHAQVLAEALEVGYQEIEAALCHWQKSPNRYVSHDE